MAHLFRKLFQRRSSNKASTDDQLQPRGCSRVCNGSNGVAGSSRRSRRQPHSSRAAGASNGGAVAAGEHLDDGDDEASVTEADAPEASKEKPCSSPKRKLRTRKLGQKSKRPPLDPYVPSFAQSRSLEQHQQKQQKQQRHRCSCGCGCDATAAMKAERWHPGDVKLSKCAGLTAAVLVGAVGEESGSSDDYERRESREIGHRRDKQWYQFQLANGNESVGYRLGPR